MSRLTKTIGKRIVKERKKQDLSQEELAEIAGLHRAYLGKIERGEYNVGIDNLKRITKALKISLVTLFDAF